MTSFPMEQTEITALYMNPVTGMVRAEFLPVWREDFAEDHALVPLSFIVRLDVRVGDTVNMFLLPEAVLIGGVLHEHRPADSRPFLPATGRVAA